MILEAASMRCLVHLLHLHLLLLLLLPLMLLMMLRLWITAPLPLVVVFLLPVRVLIFAVTPNMPRRMGVFSKLPRRISFRRVSTTLRLREVRPTLDHLEDPVDKVCGLRLEKVLEAVRTVSLQLGICFVLFFQEGNA